ncbi:MAG: hypothetical protein WC655_17670, partial [Candidatus Hydrogenedentales bacterium]
MICSKVPLTRGLCAFLLCLFATGMGAVAWSAEGSEAPAAASAEKKAASESPAPEVSKEDLKSKIADLDSRITIAENLISADRAQMFGMSVSDMQELPMTLRQLRSLLEDHIGLLENAEEAARTEADLQKEATAYKGLAQPPPYTPWFVDMYKKAVDDKKLEVETAELDLSRAKDRVNRAKADEGRIDTLLAKAREDAANNADSSATPRLEWLLDTALARRELAQATTPFTAMEVTDAEQHAAFLNKQLAFLTRKHEDAKAKLRYRPSDLEEKIVEIKKKREDIQDALQKAYSKKDSARQRLTSAREALDAAPEEGRASAQETVDVRKVEAVATSATADVLERRKDLSYLSEDLWTLRFALHTNRKSLKLPEQRKSMADYLESFASGRESMT